MEAFKVLSGFAATGAAGAVTALHESPAAAAWLVLFVIVVAFVRGAKA